MRYYINCNFVEGDLPCLPHTKLMIGIVFPVLRDAKCSLDYFRSSELIFDGKCGTLNLVIAVTDLCGENLFPRLILDTVEDILKSRHLLNIRIRVEDENSNLVMSNLEPVG